MSEYKDFTSLPLDKEQQFIVFEKQSVETSKKAMKIGMIVAGIFGLIVVAVVFSFAAPEHGSQMADDDMGMLKRAEPEKDTSAEKPASAPASEEADSPAAEGDGATDEGGDGDEEGSDEGDAKDEAAKAE